MVIVLGGLMVFGQDDDQRLRKNSANMNSRERKIVNNGLDHVYINEDTALAHNTRLIVLEDSAAAYATDFTTGELNATGIDLDATSAASYYDMINSEWTPTAVMTSGGSNGIYSIINPVYDFQNAYGLRARVDMRDAADTVEFNQIHAIDALINLSEEIYSVDDNISVFGGSIHSEGITAGDIDSTGTLNMFFGMYPASLTENFTVETNAMKIITWSGTHVDYGFNFENSGTTTSGIYLNNHASNSPATMTNGIEMVSAAGKMTYGVNMTAAGITGAEILCQNAATIDNIQTDTLTLTETVVKVDGELNVTDAVKFTGIAGTGTGTSILNYNRTTGEVTYADQGGVPVHMFVYFGDSTVSLSYTTAWAHLTNTGDSIFIQDELDGFTMSNDTITSTYGGDFDFDANFSHDGDNGETVSVRFYNVTQGEGIPVAGSLKGGGAGDYSSTTIIGYSDITAGDKIVLQYKGDASGTSVFKNGVIRIKRIHE